MSATLLTCYLHLESLPLDTVAIRNILIPKGASYTIDRVYEYYRQIICVKDITIDSYTVPDTFHMKTIGRVGSPEESWPAYDATLLLERIPMYQSFLKGVIAGEEARIVLGLSLSSSDSEEESESSSKPAWMATVEEIIETFEECTMGDADPTVIGWMWAPVHTFTRRERGLYYVTDPAWSTIWEPLLATSNFPDLELAQRFSTSNWSFKRPISHQLLKTILEWWVEAYGGTSSACQWIRSSEEILFSIIEKFQTKGLPKETPKETPASISILEQTNPVKLALLTMEETLLGSPTVYSVEQMLIPSNNDLWNQWVTRSLRFQGVPLDMCEDYIRTEIARWVRNGWGIRIDKLPYPNPTPIYETIWTSLIRIKKITEESLCMWLRLLDANDPLKHIYITKDEKWQIVSEWLPIVLHGIKSSKPDARAKTNKTFEYIRTWLFQCLPQEIFDLSMVPRRLHPAINACGHRTVHGSTGYFFKGLELPPETTSTFSDDVD